MQVPKVNLGAVNIRQYTIDDAEPAFKIFQAHAEISKKKGYLRFRTALLEQNQFFLVAECNGELIGIGGLQYIENGERAIFHTDGVMPQYQKSGIGTALVMARLAIIIEEMGCDSIALLATEFSREFYNRFGFISDGNTELDPALGFEIGAMEMEFTPGVRKSAQDWLTKNGISWNSLL